MKHFNKLVVGSLGAALVLIAPVGAIAQAGAGATIEEVLVTGRKREESLTEVPVSISVFNATLLAEAGIDQQDDLFAATPGLDYGNWNGTRTDNNPGVRGVQSELRASNQQKVASFIDGMPMNGNTGTLSFAGVDAVEVYRGPQSAAFGRSTFAGAINYVTSASAEEFEGKVTLKGTDLGGQELGLLLTGPITDNLGYRISYVNGDDTGPDEWRTTEGIDQSRQETERVTAKLNFELTDTAYGDITFSRLTAVDMPGANWRVDPTTCGAGSGIVRNNMGTMTEMPAGVWDCEVEAPAGGLPRNTDVYGQFAAQYDANRLSYEATFMGGFAALDTDLDGELSLSEYLAQTDGAGATFEQLLLGANVTPAWTSDVDRIQGTLNFEVGANLLQILGMTSEETFHRWNDNDATNTLAVFGMGMIGPNVMTMAAVGGIDELYTEVRWISPEDQRLRYTASATYYNYENNLQTYNNLGAQELGLLLPNGNPVSPASGITISENATNMGIGLNMTYDVSDRTILSLEGRYQVDEVCGQDALGANVELCSETKSFAPRIGINTTLTDSMSVYAQYSIGTNPAGVNIAYQDPGNVETLAIANGSIAVPALDTNGNPLANAGFQYGVGGAPAPLIDYDENTFQTFDEETLTNIEVGIKGSFADRRGAYTAAAYFMIYEDIIGAENLNWDDVAEIGDVDGNTYDGWNAGEWNDFTGERTWINQGDSEMYGVEVTVDYALDDTWQVGGYVTVSSADYTDYCSIQAPSYTYLPGGANTGTVLPILRPDTDDVLSACGVVNGNQLTQHSPFTANVNLSASLPETVFGFNTTVRLDIRHKGKHYEDHLNLLERAAVTTANLSANMRSENWSVRAFVNNLTDDDEPGRVSLGRNFFNNANPALGATAQNTWGISPARPREIGVQVEYNF